jgi:hypothetical protein
MIPRPKLPHGDPKIYPALPVKAAETVDLKVMPPQ